MTSNNLDLQTSFSKTKVKVLNSNGEIINEYFEYDFIQPENPNKPKMNSPGSPPPEMSSKFDQNKSPNHSPDSRISEDNEYDWKQDQELDSILEVIPYLHCKICNFEIKHFDEKEPTMLLYHLHTKLKHNSPCISFENCSCLSFQNGIVYDHYPVPLDPRF